MSTILPPDILCDLNVVTQLEISATQTVIKKKTRSFVGKHIGPTYSVHSSMILTDAITDNDNANECIQWYKTGLCKQPLHTPTIDHYHYN